MFRDSEIFPLCNFDAIDSFYECHFYYLLFYCASLTLLGVQPIRGPALSINHEPLSSIATSRLNCYSKNALQ